MIDKEQLEQLHHLNREIELLRKQIDNIEPRIVKDSVIGSSSEFPYTQHTMVITGIEEYDKRVIRLKKQLTRKLEELMDIVERLNEYIAAVPDSEMRQILTLRYINNLTWHQIAKHLGYQDESAPRKKCERFLK